MLALKARKSADRPDAGVPAAPAGEGRLVLPRPARRLVRFLVSLASGRIRIPSHTGTVSLIAFYAATAAYAMSVGGHTQDVAQSMTSAAGFAIENVKVSGNVETSEIDILEQLGLDGTTSLVALNVAAARQALTELPWVQDADVRKVYPDTVDIRLVERKAYAIWQHGQELSLIEKSGSVIAPLRDNKFASLPLFVGRDAELAAATFDEQFAAWPELKDRVKAYIRVAGRRWDLRLDNGIVIKMPEHDMERAMARLAMLHAEEKLLDRDIEAVDLRLEDRTTVQLTPGAALRRQAAVDARAKELKKEEKQI